MDLKNQRPQSGRWVTRISREKERRVYFIMTLAMIAAWAVSKVL